LGKIVSHSFDLDEVFRSLRDAITEIIDPLEINVMVKSQEKTHQLIPQTKTPYVETDIEQTTIDARQAVFPLRIQNNTLGYLEIKVRSRIPEKIVSLIRGIAIFAAISIEKYEMHSKLLERQKLEQELKIARKMQRSFLPGEDIQIDGLEVLKEIKTHKELEAVPVVILTTSEAERDVAKAYHYHANSYLVKPIDFVKFDQLMTDLGFYWLGWNHHPWS
jgi:CheY-like chemotaxis protein